MHNPFTNGMERMLRDALLGTDMAEKSTTNTKAPVLTMDSFLRTVNDFKRKAAVPTLLEWVAGKIPASLTSPAKDGHTAVDVESWLLILPEIPEKFGFTNGNQRPTRPRTVQSPSGAPSTPLMAST